MILLYIWLILLRDTLADYYGSWSSWSPCNRRCGPSMRYRYKGCKSMECYDNIIMIDFQGCYKDCQTEHIVRNSCNKGEQGYSLYNGGYKLPQGFPAIYSYVSRCQPSTDNFTITATDIPFTVREIIFRGSLISFFLGYQIDHNSNEWFIYPSSSITQEERSIYYTQDFVKVYLFEKQFEAYKLKLIPSAVENNEPTFCFQVTVHGCHLPVTATISFTEPSFMHIVEIPLLKPIIQQFDCNTNFAPMYFQHLKIIDVFNSKVLTSDAGNNLYSRVTRKNLEDVYGVSTITLFVRISSKQDLYDNFYCFLSNGFILCHKHFTCTGKVVLIGGEEIGNWDHGFLNVVFKHDVNECSESQCDLNAQCINTLGSFYCQCIEDYYGNGFTCHKKKDWVEKEMGIFPTNQFYRPILDIYCRVIFYANNTDALYACGKYFEPSSAYGCLVSFDAGVTWKKTHLFVDSIFGEDTKTGFIYGYISKHYVYVLYDPVKKMWFAIRDAHFLRVASLPSFASSRIVNPRCFIDGQRDDELHPLKQSYYLVKENLYALTSQGIQRKVENEQFINILKWSNLPFLDTDPLYN